MANTTAQNTTAKKFYRGEKSQRLTKVMTNWLFSYGSAPNMNGYSMCSGSFNDDSGTLVFWDAVKILHGSSIITYTPYVETSIPVKVKSDTLVMLEAVRDAFNDACDELDFSQFTSEQKEMIVAQRKAINLEIRMNR